MSSRLGPYSLSSLIGQGGVASVFRAEGPEGEIAIKRLHPQMARQPDQVALFVAEGELAQRFRHENLVHAMEAGEAEEGRYIAMELVRGPNLAQLCELRPPNRRAAARIVAAICAGLDHLHREGYVHCDVNPTNVLVGPERTVKLTDFGVTSESGRRQEEVRGTYAYMSPEQARGGALDPRSDVFSAGVILWELWSGQRLFRRDAHYLSIAAVVEDAVPSLGEPALDELLGGALAKEPAQRYPSCAELAERLESLRPTL
jgi:serine/threonine-protein kinase